jgi:hypothetical protein
MRYLIQFLVPALIVVVVVYLLGRTRRAGAADAAGRSDTGTFMLILVIGAAVAVASFFAVEAVLG